MLARFPPLPSLAVSNVPQVAVSPPVPSRLVDLAPSRPHPDTRLVSTERRRLASKGESHVDECLTRARRRNLAHRGIRGLRPPDAGPRYPRSDAPGDGAAVDCLAAGAARPGGLRAVRTAPPRAQGMDERRNAGGASSTVIILSR